MAGSLSLGLYAAALIGVGIAIGVLWRTSLAAEIVALVVVATYLIDLLAPPLKLPDWLPQLHRLFGDTDETLGAAQVNNDVWHRALRYTQGDTMSLFRGVLRSGSDRHFRRHHRPLPLLVRMGLVGITAYGHRLDRHYGAGGVLLDPQ